MNSSFMIQVVPETDQESQEAVNLHSLEESRPFLHTRRYRKADALDIMLRPENL